MRELLSYGVGSTTEEKLTLRITADGSGNIYIPVAGYSSEGTQDCTYNWYVSIDGGTKTQYSGTGASAKSIRVGYGLTAASTHTVTITPVVEDYCWLRAFGYKGTSYASYLKNIISDKSYKGYALSDIFTGDYFKAYQYQGCTNLINLDEELLPDTLQIIGDYYRYYEYSGCTSLQMNAEEKILKSVRAIGNYYRAYQYNGCTSITLVNMRAINRATTGNHYRYMQLNGVATDKKPTKIYIEGGIVEGGDWGLTNDNVSNIYVYQGLVADYKTKLSGITSSKIVKNAARDGYEYEFIEFTAIADSNGVIRIPVGGYSTTGTQDCAYNRNISIDGGETVNYTGTGSASYITAGSGLTSGSEHRVIITPGSLAYGWERAYGYYNTGAQTYIKDIAHYSYKGYASSYSDTGDYYMYRNFRGCTNLTDNYEKMPSSVSTIGDYCYAECYYGCTGLETAFWEILPYVTDIGDYYRYYEFYNCTGLKEVQGVAGASNGEDLTEYKTNCFGNAGDDMDVYITVYEGGASQLKTSMSFGYTTVTVYTAETAGQYWLYGTAYEPGSSGGTQATAYVNGTEVASAYSSGYGATAVFDKVVNLAVGDVVTATGTQFSYGRGSCSIKVYKYENSLGITAGNINGIYCYSEDISDYLRNANYAGLGAEKIKAYYYPYYCYSFQDINKYTKLLASVSLSGIDSEWDIRTPGRGIALRRDMEELSVPGVTYNLDSTGNNYVGVMMFKPTWTTNSDGYKVLTALNGTGYSDMGGSDYSGSNISYAGGLTYIGNTVYGHYAFNGSNYDYAGERGFTRIQGSGNQTVAGASSRSGKYLWGYLSGFKRWENLSATTYTSPTTQYGSLVFSDNGLHIITGNSTWTTLYQKDLTAAFDLDTAVDTGKSLSIYGTVCFSYDFKYMFRFDETTKTVYQYTYE